MDFRCLKTFDFFPSLTRSLLSLEELHSRCHSERLYWADLIREFDQEIQTEFFVDHQVRSAFSTVTIAYEDESEEENKTQWNREQYCDYNHAR